MFATLLRHNVETVERLRERVRVALTQYFTIDDLL